MAEKQEINILIDENGNVSLDVSGVRGSKCVSMTEDIESFIGKIENREKKSEYYQQDDSDLIKIKI